jgi:hypothetical protein
MAAGAIAGGVAGLLTGARIAGGYPAWAGAGATAGALAGALTVAPAMIVSGWRLAGRWVGLAWLLLAGLAVADLLAGTPLSPASWLGELVLWPLTRSPVAALAIPAVALLVAAGLAAVPGTSVEALHRRAGLVAGMRFAAATRDVRSLTRTGHQLAEETPRSRPWLRLPEWFGGGTWRRHWQSLLRWPLSRLARVAALALATAGALALVWLGASYFVVLAGGLAYVIALEVLEPWFQATDRPDLTDSVPATRGALLVRHLPAAVAAATAIGLVSLAALAVLRPPPIVLAAAAIVLPPAALAAVCGASLRWRQGGAGGGMPQDQLGIGAFVMVLQVAGPPSVAIIGLVPVLTVRDAFRAGHDPIGPALTGGAVVAGLGLLALLLMRLVQSFSEEL